VAWLNFFLQSLSRNELGDAVRRNLDMGALTREFGFDIQGAFF